MNQAPNPRPTHPDPLISDLASDAQMLELVRAFIGELPDRIHALESSARDHDLATLATLAHQLKGAAGGYGYPQITQAARGVELAARTQAEADRLQLQVDALINLCHRATAGLPQPD
jgi:HPt (histidine-containing phosphotransfer) domain-containing protein